MENEIINILKDSKPLTIYELNDALNFKTVEELKELLKVVNQMEDELKIYHTKKNTFLLFEDSHLKVGLLEGNKKGFGFVITNDGPDIFIAPKDMNGAIHGDKVVVEIISNKGINSEGRILKIVSRQLKEIVGEFYYKKGVGYIHPDDNKITIEIVIPKNKSLGAMNGHKVLVKTNKKISDNCFEGEVTKILGHKNDPGVDILSIVASFGIKETFDESTMSMANDLPSTVMENEMIGRHDLRKEEIFTIDGDDTKDIDDAISIKKLNNGNYELGVHIADVSYYVTKDSPIDLEAYQRGTSVYLADRVIPMLPHLLSNGICSLNPSVDRLTISCVMEIDGKGNVVDYEIFPSIINSRIQMTYNKVNDYLERNIIDESYAPYTRSLSLMSELAKILRANKEARGYIDFQIEESKIIVDEMGRTIDVKYRERGIGENIIEDFMIAANETIASHIYYMDLPFIYRVHGVPSEEKVREFVTFVNILGYTIPGKIRNITPITIKNILNELEDKKEYSILSKLMLRCMQKAVYDSNNIGHFGLGSKCYTHFTSPIRRYPDLTVHRLLRTYLFDNKINKEVTSYWGNILPTLAEHTSFSERQSVECEREVDDMKKAEYMLDHIGETYTGTVSSVLTFGMFIELPNSVEGLVRVDDMKGYYTYNEQTMSLVSDNNKKGYRIGDTVTIIVKSASKEARTVDFIIKDDENGNTKPKS